jgi:leucyl-tRNA synthetase
MGHTDSIFVAQWPSYDPSLVVEEEVTITLQVNGKLRGNMCVPVGLSREQLEENALQHDALKKWLDGKEIEKIIVVPNKLVNIVVR